MTRNEFDKLRSAICDIVKTDDILTYIENTVAVVRTPPHDVKREDLSTLLSNCSEVSRLCRDARRNLKADDQRGLANTLTQLLFWYPGLVLFAVEKQMGIGGKIFYGVSESKKTRRKNTRTAEEEVFKFARAYFARHPGHSKRQCIQAMLGRIEKPGRLPTEFYGVEWLRKKMAKFEKS